MRDEEAIRILIAKVAQWTRKDGSVRIFDMVAEGAQ